MRRAHADLDWRCDADVSVCLAIGALHKKCDKGTLGGAVLPDCPAQAALHKIPLALDELFRFTQRKF